MNRKNPLNLLPETILDLMGNGYRLSVEPPQLIPDNRFFPDATSAIDLFPDAIDLLMKREPRIIAPLPELRTRNKLGWREAGFDHEVWAFIQ